MCSVSLRCITFPASQLLTHLLSSYVPKSYQPMRWGCHGNRHSKPIQTYSTTLSEFGEFFLSFLMPLDPFFCRPRALSHKCFGLTVRNETTELWQQNVTATSVIIHVDSESRYNASVSSWTRLGDGGVIIYISFTTIDAGITQNWTRIKKTNK